ncbi:hypothetical protein [Qipengyuania sphaerica]|uniref:hypothetical protein n=1 Tax=Qipengyuania sphaerica TaxID=2867243 RepID=UPI001C87A0EA|nr:hypothetical protein [Qipengyuania sphaerica]MBX7541670.1 hypothetical protein [Qipengyuania sphaerica]
MSEKDVGKGESEGIRPSGALPPRPGSYSAEELAELERRERMSGWLLLFFGGAAIATAVLAFYLFSDDLDQTDQYERLERTDEPVPEDEGDDNFVWGQTTIAAPEDPVGPAPTNERPGKNSAQAPLQDVPQMETGPQQFEFPSPPTQASGPRFAGPPAGSVDRETSRALRSGKAQLWREQGQRGYVLVSETVTYGTRECRQVSYTRFEQGEQATSPSTQWCRLGKSGKWRPDPRGPE